MGRKIEVVEHNPAWQGMFLEESKLLKKLLGRNCVAVHHIGSTAVEALGAKPTIDILCEVKDISRVDHLNSKFEAQGYVCMGENGIEGRRYFSKGNDVHTYHVHIFQQDNREQIQRHLAVVEYLKKNERRREEYSQLKSYLAQAYPWDPEGYAEGKAYFVAQLEQEALNSLPPEEEKEENTGRSIPASLGMCIGLVLGLTVFDNIGVGLCVGLALSALATKLKKD